MMSVSSLSLKRAERSFSKIREATGLSFGDISDICLGTIKKDSHFFDLELQFADRLLELLNIDIKLLTEGTFCIDTIIKQLAGKKGIIPRKYIGNQGSKTKTIKNALSANSDYLKKVFCRSHQIHRDFLNNEDNLVSAEIFLNSLSFTANNQYCGSTYKIGLQNSQAFSKEIAKISKGHIEPVKSYEDLITQSHLVEKNMHYKIEKKTHNSLVIESRASEFVQNINSQNEAAASLFTENISGFLVGYSSYSNCNVDVKVRSCSNEVSTFEVAIY